MKCKYEGTGIYEGRCYGTKEIDPCPGYDKCSQFKPDFKTNADHIRSMTDEELAHWHETCPHIDEECTMQGCLKCILEWLKQPHEGDE